MYVTTVVPIARGIQLDELSYFSNDEVPAGALVTVPMRGRRIKALVLESVSAESIKGDIKSLSWQLKKLEHVNAKSFFTAPYMHAVRDTAEEQAAALGATLFGVFPQDLYKLSHETGAGKAEDPTRYFEELVTQDEESERHASYRSLIRETFARGQSVYFILPSVQDVEHVFESLEKGIRDYTFVLHSGLSPKTLRERWETARTLEHPVLIIATAFFLSLPRKDIATIILDRESAGSYKTPQRPFIDMRTFAKNFARHSRARIIYGDIFLRSETLYRYEQGEIQALTRPKYRFVSTAHQSIVDMRSLGEQPATGKIAICSSELVDTIEENRTRGTHLFILGVRRGYAPMTVCGDCGTVIACKNCDAPMVIHKRTAGKTSPALTTNVEQTFLCHRCGFEADTDVVCGNCGGWRLIPLGIGVAQAEEAIRSRFPDVSMFRIDRDETESHKQALEVARKFYETPGSILIGTEMALPYLTQPLAHIAVLSVNSLLTIPDFRMGERVFRLLLTLRSKAERSMLVQTRDPERELFQLALSGNIAEFLRAEFEERKRFSYPPFSTIIKFTFEGKKDEGAKVMKEIELLFSAYHPVSFPSFIARVKGKFRMNALLKVPNGAWPNHELTQLIRSLSPEIIVKVDPESVI